MDEDSDFIPQITITASNGEQVPVMPFPMPLPDSRIVPPWEFFPAAPEPEPESEPEPEAEIEPAFGMFNLILPWIGANILDWRNASFEEF